MAKTSTAVSQPLLSAAQIAQCMQTDQPRLLAALDAQRAGNKTGKAALEQAILKSIATRTQRAQRRPELRFDSTLPIFSQLEEIATTIRKHPVTILCGETGSGKTTQLPKICLQLGQGIQAMIGHTQPRRLAAHAVAHRLCQELETSFGDIVGCKVRFASNVSEHTQIKLMTDGILLTEIQKDPLLLQYDTLIIDEAHERSLQIDFLLGYLKELLPQRPDLKLIITSATIDPEGFSKYFNQAPIISVRGRSYPVKVQYRPLDSDQTLPLQYGIGQCLREILRTGPGDVLIFLATTNQIQDTIAYLQRQKLALELLPLYSQLSAKQQQQIFTQSTRRRVILATNIAETSITVPGIVYVIDSGLARLSRYSYRSQIQRLPIEKISRAAAEQRLGRCGRIAPGLGYRLYDEEDFINRPAFTEPEILRTDLAAVLLQMMALNLGAIERFPFIDTPDSRYINEAYKRLFELGATDAKQRLTTRGKHMARLPIDPKLARILLAGVDEQCLPAILTITAALSGQDPRYRPYDGQQNADEKHQQWQHPRSDFIALIKLWEDFSEHAGTLSQNKLRQWCQTRYLAYSRMREWQATRQQLAKLTQTILRSAKQDKSHTSGPLNADHKNTDYAAIHRAILTGLLNNIGCREEKSHYLGSRNRHFYLFPGSGIKQNHTWVVAGEIFETTKVFAQTVAAIEPEWILDIGQHLLKRHYFDTHFDLRSGQIKAREQSSLYGLIIDAKKQVNYGPINPRAAREVFIREALITHRLNTDIEFVSQHQQLLEQIHQLEAKTRRRDLLLPDNARIAFFQQHLPRKIHDANHLISWYQKASPEQRHALLLQREDIMTDPEFRLDTTQFPETYHDGTLTLPLSYCFHPGVDDDGVSLHIPCAALSQVSANRCSWLIPGWLEDKIIALIQALPKPLRRAFNPISACAQRATNALKTDPDYSQDLIVSLCRWLSQHSGHIIQPTAIDQAKCPEHLYMRFIIYDEQRQILGSGRDLETLQRQFKVHTQTTLKGSDPNLRREQLTDWSFGDLPRDIDIEQHGITVKGYPALIDKGDSVAIEILDNPATQARHHRIGLRRVYQLTLAKECKALRRQIPAFQEMSMHYNTLADSTTLGEDIINAAIENTFINSAPDLREYKLFQQRLSALTSDLTHDVNNLSQQLQPILKHFHSIQRRLDEESTPTTAAAIEDIGDQLAWLLYPGFLLETPRHALQHYPRYLKAIDYRLNKLTEHPDQDQQRCAIFLPLWETYKAAWEALANPQAEKVRWMLEEWRVSLFAQSLGTAIKISEKRVREALSLLVVD